eukprot:1221422-Rhodomonas_salina.1
MAITFDSAECAGAIAVSEAGVPSAVSARVLAGPGDLPCRTVKELKVNASLRRRIKVHSPIAKCPEVFNSC